MIDPNSVGQGRQFETVEDAHKAGYGTAEDTVTQMPKNERLQETEMPKAPDPSPFSLGPMAPGGREAGGV